MKRTLTASAIFSALILLLCLPVINSCEKEIDMSVPESERKLVLNGIFKLGEPVSLTVSKSKGMLEKSQVESVDNATINLYTDGSLIGGLDTARRFWYYEYPEDYWNGKIDSVYRTVYNSGLTLTEPGKLYRIEASLPGISSKAWTEFRAPSAVPILKIDTATVPSTDQYSRSLQFTMRISDPSAEKNYYVLFLKSVSRYEYTDGDGNPVVQEYENFEYIESDDVIFSQRNDNYFIDNGLIFTDEIFNGKTQDIRFKTNTYAYGSNLVYHAVLQSITEDYFNYLLTSQLYNNTYDNPIAEPVSVKSNINGGFGIVSIVSESADSSIRLEGSASPGYK